MLEPILGNIQTATKNVAHVKSRQKWLKSNNLSTFTKAQ